MYLDALLGLYPLIYCEKAQVIIMEGTGTIQKCPRDFV